MTIFDDDFWWRFLMTIFDDSFWWQFLTDIWQIFDRFLTDVWQIFDRFFENIQYLQKIVRFLKHFVTWDLRHWLHFWQLRTTIWTITLWPLNKEWRGQHSQFLRCFNLHEIYNWNHYLHLKACSLFKEQEDW